MKAVDLSYQIISCLCLPFLTFVHFLNCRTNQEQQRRAPNMVQRTEPRTSSWFSKTAWRSARGTNLRSLNSFRKSSPFPSPPMSPKWSRSNRACSMAPLNGQPRSASQVRGEVQYSTIAWRELSNTVNIKAKFRKRHVRCSCLQRETSCCLHGEGTGGICGAVEQKVKWVKSHLCDNSGFFVLLFFTPTS